MNAIIRTENLDFAFSDSKKILHRLNLDVPQGSIYCFLGPNGAGKTTTLRILLGLLKTKSDTISIFNEDFPSNRISILRRIGSLIETPSLYGHLTGRENLEVFRLSYRVDRNRIKDVLEIAGLYNARDQLVKTYSLGMKQRLAIGLTLLHDPELLILDEPTNGLDPQGIIDIRELVRRLHQDHRKTVLISSHLLSEVEKVATHFGIISKGRLRFQGTIKALREMQSTDAKVEIEVDDAERSGELCRDKFAFEKVNGSVLRFSGIGREHVPELIAFLAAGRVKIYKAGFTQSNLEDLFMKIVES